ncbi:hypothetical protein CJJ07_002050 [Candidozyma auris]|nr:hypothetical protein CJJ07_002050 [[Candida] auris]
MSLTPTYSGYIGSTKDAVLVIQGVLNQELNSVHRRPHERERAELIRSGHVFVFIEEQSGIKRWTDGVAWSPSRILGRFLVYRELDRGAMGDVKRRRKRSVAKAAAAAAAAGGHSPQLNLSAHGSPSNPYISSPSTSTSTSGSSFYPDYGLIKNAFCRHHSEKHQTNRPLGFMPISPDFWDAVQKSSLGGKIPIEDEASYFLDSNYQLQNMSVLMRDRQQSVSSPGQRPSSSPFHHPQPPPAAYQSHTQPLQPHQQPHHFPQNFPQSYPPQQPLNSSYSQLFPPKVPSVLPNPFHTDYVPLHHDENKPPPPATDQTSNQSSISGPVSGPSSISGPASAPYPYFNVANPNPPMGEQYSLTPQPQSLPPYQNLYNQSYSYQVPPVQRRPDTEVFQQDEHYGYIDSTKERQDDRIFRLS